MRVLPAAIRFGRGDFIHFHGGSYSSEVIAK
jgi:hypothetical protein